MKIVAAKYRTFQEAAKADLLFYRSLSGQQRLDLLLDLIQQGQSPHEATKGFKRVYRIIKLPRR